MDRGESKYKEPHPRERTNLVSLLSFFYTIKFFAKGYRKSLETEDLYDVLESCRSKQLGDLLETQWQKEKEKTDKPSIRWTLLKCFGKQFAVLGVIQLVFKVIFTTLSPQALSKIVAYFSPGQTELSQNDAIYYTVLGISLTILNLFYTHNYELAYIELGIRIRTGVCSLLYRKSLKLNNKALSEVTVGKIVTVMTKDIDALELFVQFGNDIWVGIVQTVIICYLIYSKIGLASFAGISFFFVILPVQMFIGRMAYFYRIQGSGKTDERLELTQQILSAIKIIKIYTWERYFEGRISRARKMELSKLHKLFYSKVVIVIIGGLCSKVGIFLFLMTHVWMGNSITAELVYYILSCFSDLEYTLSTLIPIGLSYTAEACSTCQRIESILHAEEHGPCFSPADLIPKEPGIVFTNAKIQLGSSDFNNIYLKINTHGLNVIVGNVGCGKTTFLKTILQPNSENITVSGIISYASQEPWLFPSTIQNNILFGEKFNQERYEKILEICALKYDLEMFPEGDKTIVGDRGINLSKGQQARINLARAIYKESDIYLLDDCLASLDGHVTETILKKCIQQFLAKKICVLVTNNFDFIKKAETVVIIEKNGIVTQTKKSTALNNEFFNNLKNVQEIKPIKIKEENRQEIFNEIKKSGKVDWKVYKNYIGYGGGIWIFGLVLILFILAQGSASYSEKLMSSWVTLEQNLSMFTERNSTEFNTLYQERTSTLNLFTAGIITTLLLSLVKYVAFFNFSRIASIRMHKAMVSSILQGRMHFFDTSFIGNVLNRFSMDLLIIDEHLPFSIVDCLTMVFVCGGGVFLLYSVNYVFLFETMILLVIACILKLFYERTGRNLHRLQILTRSPMIGHLNSTFEGLTTIRASQAEEIIKNEFDRHQNLYTSANYSLISSNCALGFALDLFCSIFISLVIIQFLVIDFGSSVGDVGLAITQAYVITDIIIIGIKNLTDCENKMTSAERILEYTELDQEVKTGEYVKDWPGEGLVSFQNVSLKYSDKGKEMLTGISFSVLPREKLGIVGRTGAGKSSIMSSLLRLYETEGEILIDGVNTRTIPLQLLRSKIAVIPQDPFLFSGTIRENIDPFGKYRDEEIWKVFDELHLRGIISDLSMRLDKGVCLSAGQKQLFCLARAVLCNNKIIILDEATANVDQETDSLIQDIIKKRFFNCTVIIIAHRLLSVLHCNKVIVLNKGRITEFGDPRELLQDHNSFLHCVIK